MPEELKPLALQMKDACPYLKDRVNRGRAIDSVPPDTFELHNSLSAYLSEQLQAKRMTGWSTPIMSVPSGLQPEEHFRQGCLAASPFDCDAGLPDDLEFAVRTIAEQKGNIREWRLEQFNRLKSFFRVGPCA